jgi:SAM-dependent methyltransferase
MASLLQLNECSIDELVKNRDVLHFAPEPQISKQLRTLARTYATADFNRSDVDLNLDITNMNNVPRESYDLVIACDVLEHVDDRAALKELHRILRPHATAIFTVPQKDHARATYEDETITTPEGREKAFGQTDHLRIYGDDFADRVTAAGFQVKSVNPSHFNPDLIERYVLAPPKLSTNALATNYRKIFFCSKESKP